MVICDVTLSNKQKKYIQIHRLSVWLVAIHIQTHKKTVTDGNVPRLVIFLSIYSPNMLYEKKGVQQSSLCPFHWLCTCGTINYGELIIHKGVTADMQITLTLAILYCQRAHIIFTFQTDPSWLSSSDLQYSTFGRLCFAVNRSCVVNIWHAVMFWLNFTKKNRN